MHSLHEVVLSSTEGLTGGASQAWQDNHNSAWRMRWAILFEDYVWSKEETDAYLQGCQKRPLSYISLCSLCWLVSDKVSVPLYQTCPGTNMPVVCSKPEEETHVNVRIPHLSLTCRFVTLLDSPVKWWLHLATLIYVLFYPGMECNLRKTGSYTDNFLNVVVWGLFHFDFVLVLAE